MLALQATRRQTLDHIVARSNSGVCAMEVDFARRLTGADARLVRGLLRGDRSCTYRIRAVGAVSKGS